MDSGTVIQIHSKADMPKLIPAGYLFKSVIATPEWIRPESGIKRIYSVSACVSSDFCDYITHWKHNGFWLFDDPTIIREIASEEKIDLQPMTCFYYEAYGQEYDGEECAWRDFSFNAFQTQVTEPTFTAFQGFDVVSHRNGTDPECSPLSCNSLCEKIPVNSGCLFDTFEQAKTALEAGLFDGAEPGPYRIFAVSTVKVEK